jgi:hypothetical protein
MLGCMWQGLGETIRAHWRALVYAIGGGGLAALALVLSGVVAAISVVVAVGGGLLLSEVPSRPRPRLRLRATRRIGFEPSREMTEIFRQASADGGEPKTGKKKTTTTETSPPERPIIFGRRRPIDAEAIRRAAIERARASAPGRGPLESMLRGTMGVYAQPTDSDYQEFADEVSAWGEELGGWLEEVVPAVEAELSVLVAEVMLANHARLDAEDARIVLRFPACFTEAGDPEPPEDPPPAPGFRLRRRPLPGLMDPGAYRPGPSPVVMPVITNRAEALVAAMRSGGAAEPDYRHEDAGLLVSYPRRPVRHGEDGNGGEPLRVRCGEPGEHEVAWEIHASNLPRAAHGTLKVTYSPTEEGEPVRALEDLQWLLSELGLAEAGES